MLKKRRVAGIVRREAGIIYNNLRKARRLSMIRNREFDSLIDELLTAKVNSDCKLMIMHGLS